MKTVIQRVRSAHVAVNGQVISSIGPGLLTLLGVGPNDTEKDLEWMIQKIVKMRIFEDTQGKMNLSLLDVGGEHLIVSQFTLYGDASKGNRPSFISAGAPALAEALYNKAIELSRNFGVRTAGGKFQAHMEVSLVNDGPVTLLLDSDPCAAPSAVAK